MPAEEAKCFLVASPRGWYGCGSTLSEAMKNCRAEAPSFVKATSEVCNAYAFACERSELQIEAGVNLNFFWPANKIAVKFQVRV